MITNELQIEPFSNPYKEEVKELISAIQQQEFQVAIHINDQPDLENIPRFYQKNKGNFWIAKMNGSLAGTIALLDIGKDMAALRKMFVKKEYRGRETGVGQALLNTAISWAYEKKMKRILLGTTEKFLAAQRFYEKNNFVEIEKSSLPKEFPIMKVDVKFYEYQLKETNG